MDSKELEKFKEALEKEKIERDKIKDLIEEKRQLEQDEKVKRYLKLCSMELDTQFASLSDDQLVAKVIQYTNFDNTNNIYVYMGTYRYGEYKDVYVERNDQRADYSLYVDIENERNVMTIDINERNTFERENRVVFPKGMATEGEYLKLKVKFIKDVLTVGQEEAITRILEQPTKVVLAPVFQSEEQEERFAKIALENMSLTARLIK